MSLPASVSPSSAFRSLLPLSQSLVLELSDKDKYKTKDSTVTNIFVGNLSYQTTQDDLQAAFAAYGGVERVSVVTDRDTGQPRGFAFVEMTDANAAQTAIAQLNGAELNGRALNVNEARPKTTGGGGGGYGGRNSDSGRSRGRQSRW
jgi:RNA recognition motif-containing protein